MSSEQDSNGKAGGGGARAITRGDDYEARAAMMRAFGGSSAALAWSPDGKRLLDIEVSMGGGKSRPLRAGEPERLVAEGIVPGPEGWCWAPAPVCATAEIRHTFACAAAGGDNCDCSAYPISAWPEAGAPPAWLTAAVLAALPPNGRPWTVAQVRAQIVVTTAPTEDPPSVGQTERALAHLVSTGEIEAVEGGQAWRRWGVPDGWAWRRGDDGAHALLMAIGSSDDGHLAEANDSGFWWVYPDTEEKTKPCDCGHESPPTLAAARTAALRACWERGVFGVPPFLSGGTVKATVLPNLEAMRVDAIDRPAAVRAALLAVLSRGPISGRSHVLAALDAAGLAPAATGEEAARAAREVGAVVDGAWWSLPAMVPGWGWRGSLPSYLCRLDATDPIAAAVASVAPSGDVYCVCGADRREVEQGEAEGEEECQIAAVAAARRAGLFGGPAPAVEVTGDGGPVVLPAVTSQGGEAVVKVATAPLPSGQALASHIERMVGIREGQGDCSLARMFEAFAVGVEERALARTIDHYAAERAAMLGGRPEDWRDMRNAGEGPAAPPIGDRRPTCPDCAAAADAREEERNAREDAERARDDARAQMAIEAARADRAERERDDARAKLAAVGAEIDALHARWAGTVPPKPHKTACSFCGKTRERAKVLVAGPMGVFICEECAMLCADIVGGRAEGETVAMGAKGASK